MIQMRLKPRSGDGLLALPGMAWSRKVCSALGVVSLKQVQIPDGDNSRRRKQLVQSPMDERKRHLETTVDGSSRLSRRAKDGVEPVCIGVAVSASRMALAGRHDWKEAVQSPISHPVTGGSEGGGPRSGDRGPSCWPRRTPV